MDKLEYLVRTLSRTRRKDYENYVVNAIWNRLGDDEIRPVSQQYVTDAKGRRYFIDLYFPQLNVGVECDEAYHQGQRESDFQRERTLMDVLGHVSLDSSYRPVHVDVSRGFEETERQIQDAVELIAAEARARRERGEFDAWDPGRSIEECLSGTDRIRAGDEIGFPSIVETCNALFATGYAQGKGRIRAFFVPRKGPFAERFGSTHVLWFAPLHVEGKDRGTWENYVSDDGQIIYEVKDCWSDEELGAREDRKRVVFVKAADSITRRLEYRFLGVFMLRGQDKYRGAPCRSYERTDTEFCILR